MAATDSTRSLYQDWVHRRDELVEQDRLGSPHARALLPVYDFLIRDYKADKNAGRPARYPRPTDLEVNERAIIVHHHLRDEIGATVNTRQQAESRIRGVLNRLVDDQHDKAEGEHSPDESAENDLDENDAFYAQRETFKFTSDARSAVKTIRAGRRADKRIEEALNKSPWLPSELLHHLVGRIDAASLDDPDGIVALRLLLRCHNRNIGNFIMRALRNRIMQHREDEIFRQLMEHLIAPESREEKLHHIRIALSDENAQVRVKAVELLSRIGTLDDIGLLSDLVLLPELDDELPEERPAMQSAIHRIARLAEDPHG